MKKFNCKLTRSFNIQYVNVLLYVINHANKGNCSENQCIFQCAVKDKVEKDAEDRERAEKDILTISGFSDFHDFHLMGISVSTRRCFTAKVKRLPIPTSC